MSNRFGIPVGKLAPVLLEQSEVWVGLDGIERRLEDLDRRHLEHLEPFLRKHGERLRWSWFVFVVRQHHATGREVLGEVDGRPLLGRVVPLWSDNGGNLDAAFDEFTDYELDRPLDDWLAARPLTIRIRSLLEEPNAK
jgi:hypothetical protein